MPVLDKILPQHESLYPIGLISAIIKILHIGNFFTKLNEFECNCCKAAFVEVFWRLVCLSRVMYFEWSIFVAFLEKMNFIKKGISHLQLPCIF